MPETSISSKPRWTQAFQRLWVIHWIMASCFLIIYVLGIVMARLPREVAFRGSFYNTHKSFGVLVLVLLLIRVFTLLQAFGKKYLKHSPRFSPVWIRNVILHSILYLLMLVIPISGIWLSNSGGYPIPFFFVTLPNVFAENRAAGAIAHDFHFWLSYTLLACIGLHLIMQQNFLKRNWKRLTRSSA